MLKAIILLGVSCPSAWALPTANIQKTLSSDAHNQNIVSSGTHDQKTLGQKTLSEDSHHQKIDDWTKTESETALLDARRKPSPPSPKAEKAGAASTRALASSPAASP